jgi:plastocyanin
MRAIPLLTTGVVLGLLLAGGAAWAVSSGAAGGWMGGHDGGIGAGGGMHGGDPPTGMHARMHERMHGAGDACPECTDPAEAGEADVVVRMKDSRFDPATLTITPGTRVVWVNDDDYAHTVTSDDGAFDSGAIPPGKAWAFTLDEEGTYAYHCEPHSSQGADGAYRGMVASVVVEA